MQKFQLNQIGKVLENLQIQSKMINYKRMNLKKS